MSASLPLYKQLKNKPYPLHQFMDAASLRWIFEHTQPLEADINNFIKGYKRYPNFNCNPLDFYPEDKESFRSIHGYGHGLRVSLYCWFIIQYLELHNYLSDKYIFELTYAALFHDVVRDNDSTDTEHGKKSAGWIKKSLPQTFSDEVLYAIANHSNNIYEHPTDRMKLLLFVLKSADALDRYRLPKVKWWPDYNQVPLDVKKLDSLCRFITYSIEKIMVDNPSNTKLEEEANTWLDKQGI
jgi:hypothetical protein